MNPAAPSPNPTSFSTPRSSPTSSSSRVRTGCSARLGRRPGASLGAALLALLMLFGCGPAAETQSAATPSPPAEARKIASLAPVATNVLLELERGDRIVAVDADSAKRPGLARRVRVPEDEDEAFRLLISLEPDLVVLPTSRIELSQRLAAANVRTVIVLVRRFEDGFTLYGELAGRVGLAAAARDRIAAASRPLAAIEAEAEDAAKRASAGASADASAEATRPRVAVVASFDPLVLVGEDQLATDLVSIAGGENLTEGRGPEPIPIARDALVALRPALLFHVRPDAPSPQERAALAASVADIAPLVVAEFDPERFYAPEAATAARSLRDAIAPRGRPPERKAD